MYKGLNADLVEKIVEAEVEWQHMTLMHRYNLMKSYIDSFNQKHDGYVSSNPSFKKRTEIQHTLAVDWVEKHYHTPPVLLPTTFDLPRELTSEDICIQFEDYKLLGAPVVEEELDFWAWMYVWGRFAFLGLLDWQRNYNTKPKDLAWASEQLTYATARAWCIYPSYRTYIRNTLSTLGRGGAQGQAIRDRILDIMHKHKIPETSGHFYEQWHQKLHNNTTPDDVGICEVGNSRSMGTKDDPHIPGLTCLLFADCSCAAPSGWTTTEETCRRTCCVSRWRHVGSESRDSLWEKVYALLRMQVAPVYMWVYLDQDL